MVLSDLRIEILAQLEEVKSEAKIKDQLKNIQNKLNINIGIDSNQINKIGEQVKNLQNQFNKQNKGFKIVDEDTLQYMGKIETDINKIINKYKELGTVKIDKNLDLATNQVKDFTIQLEKADGIIQKINFEGLKIAKNDGTFDYGFRESSIKEVDNLNKISEKRLVNENQINKEIDDRRKKLEFELNIYKRQAEINANNLKRRYHDSVDVESLDKYSKAVKDLTLTTPNLRQEMKNLDLDFKQVSSSVKSSHSHVLSFSEAFKTAMVKFPIWMAASTAFFGTIRSVQAMTQELYAVDQALTDLNRVTDMTSDNLQSFLQESIDLSNELGNSVKDVLNIANGFARMGFEGQALLDITKTAQVLQNISDLDSDQSVNALTTAMQNFGIAANESMTIANKLNEIDNNTAVSTLDLATGLSKASATAVTFGVSMDELLSHVAAIGTTTRETGAIIGNGLKTIYSRITTMSDSETILNSIGVSIRDISGNMKPVNDILGEVAGKWANLSAEQQQNLGVTLAGRYQLSRFLALMNNWQLSQEALGYAMNSSNSAMIENEKYQKSLEARTNKLKNAFTELSVSVGDAVLTDSLILTIEGLKDLAQFGTKVSETIGVLPIVFGVASTAVLLLSTNFKTFTSSLIFGTKAIDGTTLSTIGLSTGMNRATVATTGLKFALRGLLASTVVGAVFVAIGFALEKLISAIGNYNQKQEEIEEMQKKSTDAISNQSDKIDQLANKYEELSKIQNRTTEQEQEYVRVKNELAQLLPVISSGIDSNGNAIIGESEALKENIALLKQKAEELKKQAITKAPAQVQDTEAEKFLKQAELNDTKRQIGVLESKGISPDDERYIKLKLKEIDIQMEINKLTQDKIDIYKNLILNADKLNEKDKQWLGQLGADGKKTFDELNQMAKDISNVRIVTGDMFSASEIDNFTEKQKTALDIMARAGQNGYDQWETFKPVLVDSGFQLEKVNQILSKLSSGAITTGEALEEMVEVEKIESLSDVEHQINNLIKSGDTLGATTLMTKDGFEQLSNEIEPLNQLLQDMAEGKEISADQAMNLIAKEEALIGAITVENGVVKINEEAVKNLRDVKIKSYTDMLSAIQTEAIQTANATVSNLNNYGLQIAAIQNLQDAKRALADMESQRGTLDGDEISRRIYNEQRSQLTDVTRQLENIEKLKQMVSASPNKIGLSSSGSKDKKSGSKDKDEAKIQDVTEAIINQINAESRLAESKNKTTKEQIDEISSQQKYREQIELTNKLISGQEDEINKLTKANNNLHVEAEKVRAKTKYDTYKWFDDELNPSLAFEQLKNSLKTGTAQEELQKLFDSLQKIKLAHRDNSQAINDLTKSTKEYSQELNNLQLTAMKYEYDQQLDDIDFLIEKQDILMSSLDENSSEYSNAVLENNKLVQQKIALTEQEIQKTLDLMAVQKEDSTIMGELKERYEDLVIAQLQYEQQLKQQKTEVANEIISIMKETYEQQKELALDAIDEELDALEKSHDRKIEMLDEQNDKIQESIDLKRKQIDQEESERDFTKQRTDLQKQLQELDNRIAIQDLDRSDESQAKVIEMQKERAKIVEEIDELQHDRTIELRQQNLDELSDDFQKEYDQKKKAEDDKYNKERESIEKRKKLQEEYYDNLINDERKYAQVREEIMNGNLSNLQNQLGQFSEYIQQNMSSIGESISQNLIDKIAQAQEQLKNINSMSSSIPSSNSSSNNGSNNTSDQDNLPSGWIKSADGGLFYKDGSISYGVDKNGYIYKNGNFVPAENYKYIPQEVIDMAKKRKLGEYHIGGIVGGEGTKETKLLNSLFQVKPNEEIAKLLKGDEFVVNSKIAMPNFINNMQNILSGFKPQIAGIPTGDNYEINLNIKEFSGTKKEAESTAKTIIDILKRRGK